MATMSTPEQSERAPATERDPDERKLVDSSHLLGRSAQIAVTPLQHFLVRVARMLAIPPTARELALAADVDFPTTCRELKVLARLGVIEWGRDIRVVREPDGFFLCLHTERTCEPDPSRGGVSVAPCHEVAP
jgi:hypothetical protein